MSAPRPAWMARLQRALEYPDPEYFERFQPPEEGGRESAVPMLFAPSDHGERTSSSPSAPTTCAPTPRRSPSPVARSSPARGPRPSGEAHEEVGIAPETVEVVAELPSLFLSPSHIVTPVLAWWPRPGAFDRIDAGEVHRAERVRVDHLLDASIRFTTVHPLGYEGPAFEVDGLDVWGFTAMLFSRVMQLAGLEQPWDPNIRRPLPERFHPRDPAARRRGATPPQEGRP